MINYKLTLEVLHEDAKKHVYTKEVKSEYPLAEGTDVFICDSTQNPDGIYAIPVRILWDPTRLLTGEKSAYPVRVASFMEVTLFLDWIEMPTQEELTAAFWVLDKIEELGEDDGILTEDDTPDEPADAPVEGTPVEETTT